MHGHKAKCHGAPSEAWGQHWGPSRLIGWNIEEGPHTWLILPTEAHLLVALNYSRRSYLGKQNNGHQWWLGESNQGHVVAGDGLRPRSCKHSVLLPWSTPPSAEKASFPLFPCANTWTQAMDQALMSVGVLSISHAKCTCCWASSRLSWDHVATCSVIINGTVSTSTSSSFMFKRLLNTGYDNVYH